MAASTINRQDNQPVFVLHTYPFKETSLVVELLTRDFGRIAAVAKGARRPRSAMRGMLQSFQPLVAAWSGKAELKTLHSLEWGEGLLPREDEHALLFDYYSQTLRTLALGEELPATLRRFELRMLQEMGYALPLDQDERGQPILPERNYYYVAEHGPRSARMAGQNGVQLSGQTLLDMAQDLYIDAQTRQQSKQLMRFLLAHYLGDKPLHTRQLLIDLQEL